MFIDRMLTYNRQKDPGIGRSDMEEQYYGRDDKILNKLSLVEIQCDWLREIGFYDVDIFFKVLELALFGGRKPQ